MLQVLFWIAAVVIGYTFLGYPLLVGVLARFKERPVARGDVTPFVSLVIPAYNEASVIARKIDNSLRLDYPGDRLEIVVITDGSDDDTVEIVSSHA